jgi:hypothetical protein
MDEKKKIENYYDCKEEVRELERLLHEARLRYRSRAKRLEKQSFSDYLREWYEWLINKKKYVNDQLMDVRNEKKNFNIKEEEVNSFGMKSIYNLISTNEHDDLFEECYKNYHMNVTDVNNSYEYYDTGEI